MNTAVKERLDGKNYKKWNKKNIVILGNKIYVHKRFGFKDSKREKKWLQGDICNKIQGNFHPIKYQEGSKRERGIYCQTKRDSTLEEH